jgi:hypothetical protein
MIKVWSRPNERRALALNPVAEAYVKAGLRPEAVATFERAFQAASPSLPAQIDAESRLPSLCS